MIVFQTCNCRLDYISRVGFERHIILSTPPSLTSPNVKLLPTPLPTVKVIWNNWQLLSIECVDKEVSDSQTAIKRSEVTSIPFVITSGSNPWPSQNLRDPKDALNQKLKKIIWSLTHSYSWNQIFFFPRAKVYPSVFHESIFQEALNHRLTDQFWPSREAFSSNVCAGPTTTQVSSALSG